MSFSEACLAALFRSLGVATIVWLLARIAATETRRLPQRRRRLVWGLLWLPFLLPGMFVGYAYNGWVLFLSSAGFWTTLPAGIGLTIRGHLARHAEFWNESLLLCLLVARLLPVGTALASFAPPSGLTPAARHLGRLALARETSVVRRWWQSAVLFLRSQGTRTMPCWGLLFLLAFQEFELVARLARPGWTVWLIDAQATGVSLPAALWRAVWPAGCEALVLWPVLAWWRSAPAAVETGSDLPVSIRLGRPLFWLVLSASLLLVCVIPVLLVSADFPAGLRSLVQQPATIGRLLREIAIGLLVAGLATAAALGLVRWRTGPGPHSAVLRGAWLVAVGGGLLGSLLISLLLLAGLRGLGAGGWGRTLVPWGLAQTLLLLPRAACLELLVRRSIDSPAVRLAQLLAGADDAVRQRSGRELVWQLQGYRVFGAAWLLWYGAYFDLATGQMLAPAGMASAPVTLYIQMHYGRNAVLSAMTAVTVLSPVAVAGVLLLTRPLWWRGGGR